MGNVSLVTYDQIYEYLNNEGQWVNVKSTYLKNGDMLYYSESGGSTYLLSVGVAYETVRIKPTLIKQQGEGR